MIEPYGQAYGRYTGLGGAVSLDEYELRPQINDRFNVSYQKEIWGGTSSTSATSSTTARACRTTST